MNAIKHTSKLLLATTNPGKIAELLSLLKGVQGWEIATPMMLGVEIDVAETGASYAENAALKAREYAKVTGMAALADDSGLELEALNGAPGLISARFSPKKGATAADRRRYLLEQLTAKPRPWRAKFVSTLCFSETTGELFFASGECAGEIIDSERGDQGFGYDPIFLVDGYEKTMAELNMREKNQLSHRALALQTMRGILSDSAAGH